MALPGADDQPPTASELKQIQVHAGELSWLATHTRADLAYWTSILASAATKHESWRLALVKKVHRYLPGTMQARMTFKKERYPKSLITWSDASFGGVSTTSQSGVIVSWGGSVVLLRSSRQSTSALSTCEAEVAAAAIGLHIIAGVRSIFG